ncbi:hypothetical protein [Actinospica robiniae]|uniref:hypothetical protein n=1 Tax=Actinospica robiniae TaxID=304901 RepID=UPI0012FB3AF6|nr:hypothetical protein [Actinospica robiniae]
MDVRKREARARMAATGETYTQAARRTAESATRNLGLADAIAAHIQQILRTYDTERAARLAKLEELEAQGKKIVDGGPTRGDGWAVFDWRTGAKIAEGTGDDEYEAACRQLDPDEQWWHRDNLSEYVDTVRIPPTPGLPPSLGKVLEEWIANLGTPLEEIADVAGLEVEEVERCLTEV